VKWRGTEREAVPRPGQTGAKLFELGSDSPYRHAEGWTREESSTGDRLTVGGGATPFALFRTLVTALAEPLYILVVLRTPRATGKDGRYQSTVKTHAEVAAFLDDFETLFSTDPRAQVWVGQTDGGALLVFDEHDLIYVYGPLDRFERLLTEASVPRRTPTVPSPHIHHYDPRRDEDERRLVHQAWGQVLPLEEQDLEP
jgi:hypothetical protein